MCTYLPANTYVPLLDDFKKEEDQDLAFTVSIRYDTYYKVEHYVHPILLLCDYNYDLRNVLARRYFNAMEMCECEQH